MPAKALSVPVVNGERRGLGGAEAGHDHDLFAAGLDGHVAQLVPEPLPQTGRRIEQQLHSAEEVSRSTRVAAQMRHQHLVEARHGEVGRARDLAQVAERGREERRRRLAFVDVERAAVVEHQAEVVVAAGGVVPRQPVADDRRLVGQKRQHRADHLLVGAQHPLRVDHALRPSRRSRGEEHLGDRVAGRPLLRAHRRRRSPACLELGERCRAQLAWRSETRRARRRR